MIDSIQIELDGNNFDDLNSFYDEVQRKICPGFEGFGRNFNALADVLRGGFGLFDYGAPISITRLNSGKSRKELGYEATVLHIEDMMRRAHPSNLPKLNTRLLDAKNAEGETLFDELVEILGGRSRLTLR